MQTAKEAVATMFQKIFRGHAVRQKTKTKAGVARAAERAAQADANATNMRQRRRKTAALILKCLETLRTLPEEMKTHIELDETIRRVLSDPLFMTQAMFDTNVSSRKNFSNGQGVNHPSRAFTSASTNNYFLPGPRPNLVNKLNTSALVLTTTSDQLLRCADRVDELLFSLFSIQDELYRHAYQAALHAQQALHAGVPSFQQNAKSSFCGRSIGAGVAKKFICESPAAVVIIDAATRGAAGVYFEGVPPNMKTSISYLLLYSKLIRTEFKLFTPVRDTDLQRFNNPKSGVALLKNLVVLNTSRRDRLMQSNAPAWMTPYMIATEFAGNINERRIENVMKRATFNKISSAEAIRLLKMIDPVRKSFSKMPLDIKQKGLLTSLLTSNANGAAKNYDVLPEREIANILKSTSILKYYSNQLPANLANATTKQKSMAKIVTLALKYMVGLGASRLQSMTANKNGTETHAYQRIASEVVQQLKKHATKTARNVKTAKRVRITKMPGADPFSPAKAKAEFSGNTLNALTLVNGNRTIRNDIQAIRAGADAQMLKNKFRQAQNGSQTTVGFMYRQNYYTIENITR
jgi:hypothetical protein